MVGIFSRLSSKSFHRRAQSALDGRGALPSVSEATTGVIAEGASAAPHGIAISTEFKPVERPSEPLDNDQPIQCPLPEPSVHNDGRIWKERVSSVAQMRGDTPAMQDQTSAEQPDSLPRQPRPPPNQVILPSVSAPEHNILKLLDECNASGIQSYSS